MGEAKHMNVRPAGALGCGPFSFPSATPDSLRLAIFERIRAEGSVSRATIAKDLDISPATVTTQASALIDMGIVRELSALADGSESSRGRPPIALGVTPDAHLVAGIKLSENVHTAVVYNFAGEQVASATAPASNATDQHSVLDAATALINHVCAAASIAPSALSAVGVGLPGFIDHENGIVHWSPIIEPNGLNFANLMSDRMGVPVTIDNDANLVALAELWFGVGRQISDFAVVTIEQGVGMGLVINHKLYRGARGLGMELGHTKVALDGALCRCGQRGCLEAYVSDYALVREAVVAINDPLAASTPVADILEHLYRDAKSGNLAARSIFERAGKYLALALGNVLNLFDPEVIILAGERMQYDYLYSDTILEEMRRHALNSSVPAPPVEVHAWGDLVWASGAAALALSHVTEHQLTSKAATLA